MLENLRLTLRSAFFEAVFVVFGVVLALAANEWRQKANANQMAQEALGSIVAELKTNQNLIADSQQYHQAQVGKLVGMMKDNKVPTMDDYPRGFINPAWVTDTAWTVAQETGVLADMDYNTVLVLSATYESLERYEKQSDMVGQKIYGELFDGGAESLAANPKNLMNIIYTFIYREEQLKAGLQETLQTLT